LSGIHRHVLAAGRQHIEVVRQIQSLERNIDRLAGASTHQIVHTRIALQPTLDNRRGGALCELHPLDADLVLREHTRTADEKQQEYSGRNKTNPVHLGLQLEQRLK
jgi:hypothetical protein